jgi:mannose-6-phosphate isomerase-like protein (cupin superfamily)
MILRRREHPAKKIVDCHEGKGILWCAKMLADYEKTDSGFKYTHDNHLDPGTSIGEHRHNGDEEIYVILSGCGVTRVAGEEQPIGPGDMCLTRHGHNHDLVNDPLGPMHFLVICTNKGGTT